MVRVQLVLTKEEELESLGSFSVRAGGTVLGGHDRREVEGAVGRLGAEVVGLR